MNIKGIIIIPKCHEKSFLEYKNMSSEVGFYNKASIFYYIHEKFDFEIRYANEVNILSNTDILIMFSTPQHSRPKIIPGLLDVNKNTKLILYPSDLHSKNNETLYKNRVKVFEKCDLILSSIYEFFIKSFPQFISKHKFMPNYFSPHKNYTELPFNNNSKMKCLIIGASKPLYYPLRHFIRTNPSFDIDIRERVKEYKFPKLINSYFCSVTTSSVFNYVVKKCFEIPAAGSLLITNETIDLKKSGFIANKHYIPVNQKNIFKKINHIIKYPDQYEHIRKEGMDFVHKNHSINNRMQTIKKVFKELLE